MADQQPQVTANEGSADQLPRGAATDLNAAMPSPTELAAGGEPTPPEGVSAPTPTEQVDMSGFGPADAQDWLGQYEPTTEDEAFIVGPTGRPDESQTVGTTPVSPVSAQVRYSLPALQRAAEEPGASETLKALVANIARRA